VFFNKRMIIVTLLVVFLIFLVRSWYRNHYQYWIKRGFVSDKPNFPLDSLTSSTRLHLSEAFDEIYQRFKGQAVVGLFFVFTPAIAVYDPDLIQSIIVKDFASFHDHYLYYNEETDPLSAHLLSVFPRPREIRS
jgi:cytochrome P450 family 6